eukprot:12247244-Alexandrium_andersonii.AAC.1
MAGGEAPQCQHASPKGTANPALPVSRAAGLEVALIGSRPLGNSRRAGKGSARGEMPVREQQGAKPPWSPEYGTQPHCAAE